MPPRRLMPKRSLWVEALPGTGEWAARVADVSHREIATRAFG